MRTSTPFSTSSCLAAAFVLVAVQSGCTSALTTAYLRDAVWAGADHAASTTADGPDGREDEPEQGADAGPVAPAPAVDRDRREAALEEARARLSRHGSLDPAVEAALVATLQRTQPEDWPVVVEEFVGSLATTEDAPAPAAPVPVEPPADTAAEPATLEPANLEPTDDVSPAVQAESTSPAPRPAAAAVPAAIEPAVPEPVPVATPEPTLTVRSACFVSAVRAWGDVDRFAADRFRPGQDVIVYVELDNLSAGASPAGHTTCIDAVLRLVDDSGDTLHTWSFDPVAETSPARRRDYFARYILRVPESAPAGSCRVEVDVIDNRSGATARTAIPLEIASAD